MVIGVTVTATILDEKLAYGHGMHSSSSIKYKTAGNTQKCGQIVIIL